MKKTKTLLFLCALAGLGGCLTPPPAPNAIDSRIAGEIDKAGERKIQSTPRAVDEALLPPLRMEMPSVAGQPIETRFDLSVNNAPAQQVFMSLVSGTRYSMLVHPG